MSLVADARVGSRDFEVSLRVESGHTLAVLGPNGAGKSTLLAVLAGLLRPDLGRIVLDDRTLFDHTTAIWTPPHHRGVALLAQEPLLFPHLTARANVAFGPRSLGRPRHEADAAADRWLAATDTADLGDRMPQQLSGGQAQRVAIARALATEPRLLLLDEPLSALDAAVAPTIRRMLRAVLSERTAIVVTHDVLDAYVLADVVAIMHNGRVVEHGPVRDVLERPRTAFTAELTGVTLLTGTVTASGLVTDAGVAIETSGALPLGAVAASRRVGAVVRPADVRVGPRRSDGHAETVADAATDAAPADNVVAATVTDLEPRGDVVRVRTDVVAADAPPSLVADLDLAPGSPVTLTFRAGDVRRYALTLSRPRREAAHPPSLKRDVRRRG